MKQVEALEREFLAMGTATNHKFEKRSAKIQENLGSEDGFEDAQVRLGVLLGFESGNSEEDGAPDPWWLGDKMGIVFESHAGGNPGTVFGAVKARQAADHPKWLRKNIKSTQNMDISSILITPCSTAKSGAEPHLDEVFYWVLDEFRTWATHAVNVIRDLKGTFPGEGDLIWRSEAAQRLDSEGLTLKEIKQALPKATEAMKIVQ